LEGIAVTVSEKLAIAFLRLLANGFIDPLAEPGTLARIAVLRAQYASRGMGHMDTLIADALAAYVMAEDAAYLKTILDGSGDVLSEDTFPRMEPMFARYVEGSAMYTLLENAAIAFSHAADEAAAWALADRVIEQARLQQDDGKLDRHGEE
jgi:hypothetical protein